MNTPIRRPFLERRNGNLQEQKTGYTSAQNVFPANSLVYLTGAATLAAIATAGVACYGWSHGPNVIPGTPPPQALQQLVYPFAMTEESLLIMSTTNAAGDAGNNAGAATAPALSTVVIGQTYGILNPTTGPNAGIQMVNLSDTTNGLLTVVALYPNQNTGDLNGLVLVRINKTAIQA